LPVLVTPPRDRFDIHARASAPIPPGEQKDAIMALFAERFNLSVHYETRDLPVMVLLAPKKPVGLRPAVAGETYSVRYNDRGDPSFTAEPMSAFTNYLANMWHALVVDQTVSQVSSISPLHYHLRPVRSGATAFAKR
jgi:uncharacterized protein (TIGR03435 family)